MTAIINTRDLLKSEEDNHYFMGFFLYLIIFLFFRIFSNKIFNVYETGIFSGTFEIWGSSKFGVTNVSHSLFTTTPNLKGIFRLAENPTLVILIKDTYVDMKVNNFSILF